MSCSHCVKRISKVLEENKIKNFDFSLSEKKLHLETEDVNVIIKELEDIGYSAKII